MPDLDASKIDAGHRLDINVQINIKALKDHVQLAITNNDIVKSTKGK